MESWSSRCRAVPITTSRQAEGLDAGGAVEGLGDRRAPVDDERVQALVGHRQAPDVVGLGPAGLTGVGVDPPEEEGLVTDGELIEAVQGRPHHDVTLDEVPRPAHGRHRDAVAHRGGLAAHVIECSQGAVEERLLLGDLTLVGHRLTVLGIGKERF